MGCLINKKTVIVSDIEAVSVKRAINVLQRDIGKACRDCEAEGTPIRLVQTELRAESYRLEIVAGELQIHAGDDLGFIYGLYEISRSILGITDFWFWNDQPVEPCDGYPVADDYRCYSKPYRVRFRGWFVNDEVLLHTWSVNDRREEPWEMVFETLLRCSGNMVIPGTDRNAARYHKLASEMGLYITHHHAEPLGTEMFVRAYPDLNPSFDKHEKLFIKLWEEAIERQNGEKIVWNLGFRGQGDCPFWANDPRYDTPAARGKLIGSLIRRQYEMVRQADPEAVCCSNLYGETMELYRDGMLVLPDDVIKIWADNGYGKMVSRRQENHNPRVPALPEADDTGMNGIYYHVSFYDLQAANHITMLPNTPEFVMAELTKVMEHGGSDYWLINCSNVKPHVYYLDFIASMWRNGGISISKHRSEYIRRYYGDGNEEIVAACLCEYHSCAVQYGPHEDEHAGEQFSNHVARMLISDYMKGEPVSDHVRWAIAAADIRGQISWYELLCKRAKSDYQAYLAHCEAAVSRLTGPAAELFRDSFLLQTRIHYHCYAGAYAASQSLREALAGQYQHAFYLAGQAREEYLTANQAMREREHGKWAGFYANECLTDIKQTAWVLEGLMAYLRNLGDGPHFYEWQREFLYEPEDRRVLLLLNMENHLTDKELFCLMQNRCKN